MLYELFLKKSCSYIDISRNTPADSRRVGEVRTSPQKPYVHQTGNGKEGFKAVYEYLINGGKSCMAGFVLKNTLSDNIVLILRRAMVI